MPHLKIKCLGQMTERIQGQRRKSDFLFMLLIWERAGKAGVNKFSLCEQIWSRAAFWKQFFFFNSNAFSEKRSPQLSKLVIVCLEPILTIWSNFRCQFSAVYLFKLLTQVFVVFVIQIFCSNSFGSLSTWLFSNLSYFCYRKFLTVLSFFPLSFRLFPGIFLFLL